MSESETELGGIRDEDLPEDLQPGDDNPLAEPLDEDVDPDDLDLTEGKTAEESEASAESGESEESEESDESAESDEDGASGDDGDED